MKTSSTTDDRGQAAVEAAIGLFAFAFVVAAFVAFAGFFVRGFESMGYARDDAGEGALDAGSGERQSGATAAFAGAMHPERDALPGVSVAARPWAHPRGVFPDDGKMAQWEGDSPVPLELIRGEKTESFDLDLRLFGVDLFPEGVRLTERAFLPPMGGL